MGSLTSEIYRVGITNFDSKWAFDSNTVWALPNAQPGKLYEVQKMHTRHTVFTADKSKLQVVLI